MSRHRDKHDKARLGRARSELEKGLARRDVDRALGALLLFPRDARDEAFGPVFSLLKGAVKTAHASREWGRLVFFAARVEAEPRLLLVEPEAAVETRWSLLWGCAMAGEWERATRLWTQLQEVAEGIPPAKAGAMQTWLDAKGTPDPDSWKSLGLPEPPALDPRLGFEPVSTKARRVHNPPKRAEDADGALVGLRAGETWPVFAATTERWLTEVAVEVKDAVRAVAADLAMHEALMRSASSEPSPSQPRAPKDGDPYEPLTLFARCAPKAGEGRSETALLALRLCLHALAADVARRPTAHTLGQIVRLAVADPAVRSIVADSLEGIARDPALGDYLLPALEAVHDATPSARIWALGVRAATLGRIKKLRAEGAHESHPVRPPAWLEKALPDHPEAAESMVAWLRRDARAADDVIGFVVDAMPVDRAAAWLAMTWPRSDEATRVPLARGVDSLLERLSSAWCDDCNAYHSGDFVSYGDLSLAGKRVWERLEPLVFMHAARFLDVALDRASEPVKKRELLLAYAGPGQTVERCLEATRAASEHRMNRVATTLRRRIVSRFIDDSPSLARAVLWCLAHDPTSKSCVTLSRALLESTAGGTVFAGPTLEKAVRVAKRMAGRGAKRSPAAKKPRTGEQVELFGGG